MGKWLTISDLLENIIKRYKEIEDPDLFAYVVSEALLIGISALHKEPEEVIKSLQDAVRRSASGK